MTPFMNTDALRQLDAFRDLINQTHPMICIAGCYFEPAEALQALDPIAFEMLLAEFVQQDHKEHMQ